MTKKVALFAECSATAGTGHVVETLSLADEAGRHGISATIVVPVGTPEALLRRARGPVKIIPSLDVNALRPIARGVARDGARVAVMNFRSISNAQINAVAGAGLSVVCIDEPGDRELACAVVVNPSPLVRRHRYTSSVPGFALYAGPEYLALSPEYRRLHAARREFDGGIRAVAVSLGGADRTGATRRVVEALSQWPSGAERHIVVGAASPWRVELTGLLGEAGAGWHFHENLPTLSDLFFAVDVALTAGGNTLYELACVGTPAVVLHEDPHEEEQAAAFAARGFGLPVGSGLTFHPAALHAALDRLEDPALRRKHGDAGRRLVDGRGAERLSRILATLLSHDPALAT